MGKTMLYTGGTGCGKTYKAITESTSFVIAVPCRQLAYEIYFDYPQHIERIDTGELHMGKIDSNQVCVYENLTDGIISQDVLIVDEAHYLSCAERGGSLFEKVLRNKIAGKQIILLTATDTLSDEIKRVLDVHQVELQPFMPVPTKTELTYTEFCYKVHLGMTAIVFVKYTPGEETAQEYADAFGIDISLVGILSASTPSYERLRTQLNFKFGKLQVVIATNVLAQGLNFPAQGVLIEYNQWDTWELIQQKLGRIARPLFGITEGFYSMHNLPGRERNHGIPAKNERVAVDYFRPSGVHIYIHDWGFQEHQVPSNLHEYSSFKYGRQFLLELRARLGTLEPDEEAAIAYLNDQSQLIKELLLTRNK
jgi:Helicase conserved C-terminal domain